MRANMNLIINSNTNNELKAMMDLRNEISEKPNMQQ